ncbi:MAG: beta strand repeat-containing protein, partial [Planctomycetaceae bacterium]
MGRGVVGLISLVVITTASEALASIRTWTGGGADSNWSTTANWSSVPNGNDDILFSGTNRLNSVNNLDAVSSANNGIEFAASAGAFTLSGSGVTLDAPVFTLQNSSTNLQTINFLTLAMAANGIYNANAGNMLIQSPISGAGFTATFSSTSGLNGTILTGSNSYSGVTTVSSGFLRIENANALGTTGSATSVTSGAALQLANNITVGAEGLTLNGSGIASTGALRNVSGTNTYGGAITFASAATIGADAGTQLNLTNTLGGNFLKTFVGAGNITATNVISGATSGMTMSGSGTLTLSANNTVTGTFSINNGVVRATTSAGALGSGTLHLGGGVLELANDTGLAFNRNTTLLTSGTIFSERLTSGAGVTHTLGTLGIGAQTLTLNTDANVTSGTAGLTFGAVTGTGAATFISNRGATANTLLTLGAVTATNFGITVGGSGDTNITGVVGLGTGGLTKTGTGTLTLSAANTYTGTTSIQAGTLSISATNNLGNATSAVLLGDALNEGTLSYTGTSVPFTRGFTIGAGGGQLDVTRSGTTLTVSGTSGIRGTGPFTVGGLGNVTVSSTISGISGLTMAGSGTLTLSATNTFGGTTTVNSGVLRLGNASALSGSNAVTVAGGTLDNGGFTNSVASFTITGGVFSGTGTLTASTYSLQGGTISANLGSGTIATLANTTLSATSAASAVQLNAGTLTLSTANLLSAAPVVTGSTGATLALGGNQTVGSIAGGAGVSLGSNTLTTGTSNASTTLSGDVSGSGGFVKVGSGTFTLSGNNSYSGTTSINAGAVSVGSVASGAVNQALGTGDTVNLGVAATSSGRLLYTGGAGTLSKNVFALGNGTDTIQNAGSGLLTLSGTLQKNGTILRLQGGAQGINVTGRITGTSQNSDLAVQNGLTTLSTTNSYNGPTFINSSGTLALGISNAIPSNSAVTIGGTFAGGNGGAGTLSMGSFTNAIGSLA